MKGSAEGSERRALGMARAAGLECDSARIASFPDRLFLILGARRRSEGEWLRNGEPWSFDYTHEKVVASGADEDALLASAKEYKRLTGLTMEQYIAEKVAAAQREARPLSAREAFSELFRKILLGDTEFFHEGRFTR